jgi:predicted aspartyl protease
MKTFLGLALLLAAALADLTNEPSRASGAYRQSKDSAGVDVPLQWLGNKIVVEAKVNGKGPYTFFFDTGAQGAVLDQGLAEELKLPVIGEGKIASPGGKGFPAKQVRFDLEIGDLKLPGMLAMSFDRSKLFPDPKSPRGVLSAKMFPGNLVTLDFARDRLVVRPGELPNPDGKTVFACNPAEPIPVIPITIAGKEVQVHIDTGAAGGISLPLSVAERLPLASKPVEVGRGKRVDRELVIFGATLNGQAKIGTLVLDNPKLRLEESKFERGILGNEILRRFELTFDSKNNRIRLVEAAR